MPTLLRWLGAGVAVVMLGAVTAAQRPTRPAGWNDVSHGAQAAPDYAGLFATDRVHEIRISMTAERFAAMQADLKEVLPDFGRGFGPGGFGPPPPGGPGPGRGGAPFGRGRGPIRLTSRDPIYVPVTVEHDGRVWTRVAMRYKGNSSLISTVADGNGKVPFRLDFDRYEDESPEIQNQRFYGFQELTFSSNFGDDSQLHELFASELFRDRGVPAPRAAFYRVVADTGSGPEYWGLYTMVEDPSDGAMLQAQFGSREGNLYKPDGPGADWTTFDPEGFEKKTNERQPDFSDVRAAVTALHATVTPADAWRTALENVFDVELFLRWLAVNTTINNWDAYGGLAHNYYLYADPSQNGRLRWIPWDNNFAFMSGRGFGGRGFGGRGFPGRGGPPPGAPPGPFPGRATNDVLHAQVGPEWPLIQRLLADPVYQARYRAELERAIGGLLEPTAFEKRARELHALIAPSVVGPQGERPTRTTISSADAFNASIDGPDGLLTFIRTRRETIVEALRTAAGR